MRATAKYLRHMVPAAQFLRLRLRESRQIPNESGNLAENGTRLAPV